MVYQQKFIAAVKVNNKILREVSNTDDTSVFLPFGSEYSLFFKNLDSQRCVVNVEIDGQDVLDGKRLIVDGNNTSELEGFLKGNVARNKFKFIQKTEEIQEHRGDRIDDGIIRISYKFEIPASYTFVNYYVPQWQDVKYYRGFVADSNFDSGFSQCSSPVYGASAGVAKGIVSQTLTSNSFTPAPDEGITVKGSEINQSFSYGSVGSLGEEYVMIIRLKGWSSKEVLLEKPLLVSEKVECPTCGKKNKSGNKFCHNCGTYLL